MYSNQRRRTFDRLGLAADFDSPRVPRRKDLIYDDCGTTSPRNVSIFLRVGEVLASNIDSICIRVVAPTDRHDVGCSVLANRRDPRQSPLAAKERQLGLLKPTHRFSPRLPR